VKTLNLQIQKSLPHNGKKWAEKSLTLPFFKIKRLKSDGKLTGQLQVFIDLDTPNTEH
jgi:hypothetical protein